MKQPALSEAVEQLIEKLNHPLDEIRERAMKTLALKLQGRLLPRGDLVAKYPQMVGTLLVWINEKQKAAKPESLLNAIKILESFAEDEEGRQVECKYGCVEFFSEYRKNAPSFLAKTIDSLITSLLKTRRYVNVPLPSSGTVKEATIAKAKPNTISAIKPESASVPSESCEFPFVNLTEAEEKTLFDANVVIRYGDPAAVINMCEQLELMLDDFPVECLLQRTDLIKSLLHRLESEKDFAFHHFAVPVLRKVVAKLKAVYNVYVSNFARPSELPLIEKFEQKVAGAYLEGTYPAVLGSKYDRSAAANKLCIDSMSHLSALGLIAQKCVKSMKDKSKLGYLVLLYQQALAAIFASYKPENERLTKELFVPTCASFVEVIQSVGLPEICGDPLLRPILQAASKLCEFLGESAQVCFRAVPKIFSALEEASYYDCFEDAQLENVKKVMAIVNPDMLASLKKCQETRLAIGATAKYQQNKQASSLSSGVRIETHDDVVEALDYLGELAKCLEFYSEKDCLLEDIVVKCVKLLHAGPGLDPDGTMKAELISRVTELFRSPHDSHKLRLLKAILSDIKTDLRTVKRAAELMQESAIAAFCSLPSIIEVLMKECIMRNNAELQTTYFQILVLLLDEDYCKPETRRQYVGYIGLLQGLSARCKELGRLIARIELTDERARYLRVLRDLFSADEEKRRFATLAFKQRLGAEKALIVVTDLTKEAGTDTEEISKLGKVNPMQINEFDVRNLLSLITQEDNLDFAIKKSALEQLVFYLSDPQQSARDLLFRGKVSLFSHCLGELLKLSKELSKSTSNGNSIDLQLHPSRLGYIGQCMHYLNSCYIYFQDEECVKGLFGQSILFNMRDYKECGTFEKVLELALSSMTSRNREVRWNGQLLGYLLLFDPYLTRVSGEDGKVSIRIQDIMLPAFQNLLNAATMTVESGEASAQLCSDREKRLVELLVRKEETTERIEQTLSEVLITFTEECNKLESYQNLMKAMGAYTNLLGAMSLSEVHRSQTFPDENAMLGIRKVLSLLPIGDSEVHFLGDFLSNLSALISTLGNMSAPGEVMNGVAEAICKTVKKDIFPFLYEIGVNLEGKRVYLAKLLDVVENIMRVSKASYTEYIGDQDFTDYLAQLWVCSGEDEWLRRKINTLVQCITGPRNIPAAVLRLNTGGALQNIIGFLNSVEIADRFSGSGAIHVCLMILQQLLRFEQADKDLAGTLNLQREATEKFHLTTTALMGQYKSFGWLTRFLVHRHTKIRVRCWQLISSLVGTELLEGQPTLLKEAVETILRQAELYGIKVRALDFLSRVVAYLSGEESVPDPGKERVSLSTLIETIRKSGLISRCKGFFVAKDVPMLFVASLLDLLKKIIVADCKNVLSTLTQIDFWTLLSDYMKPEEISRCDATDRRATILRLDLKSGQGSVGSARTLHICLTAIFEFVAECLFREPQLANHLLKSTKILQHTMTLLANSAKFASTEQKGGLKTIMDVYTNRGFTLCALFADYELNVAAKIVYEELVRAGKSDWHKANLLLSCYHFMSCSIDSATAVLRLVAKLVEGLSPAEEEQLFEREVEFEGKKAIFSRKLVEKLVKTYVQAQATEESGDNTRASVLVFSQQKYDVVKCLAMLVGHSRGAKAETLSGSLSKLIAKDLSHLTSIVYCAVIEGKPSTKYTAELTKTKRSVMLNKDVVQRDELLNVGFAREMLQLLLQFLKGLFLSAGPLIAAHRKNCTEILSSLITVYGQAATLDEQLMDILLEVLATLASQSAEAKELFLHKDSRQCFIDQLLKLASGLEIGMDTGKIHKVFAVLQSLCLGRENANYVWKYKFVDTILRKLCPILKQSQKDFAEACPLLSAFTRFLAVYAYSDDGRKFLQGHKTLFEFYVDILSREPRAPGEIVQNALLLLRNAAFSKGTKLHFLSLPNFATCLIGYTTGIKESVRTKCLAANAIWAYLYNHQGVKASLNKENIRNELELNKLEYERELDKLRYQEYHGEERGNNDGASASKDGENVRLLVTALTNILNILAN